MLVEKKNENALKHLLISSTKHIQADDIKLFCGYLKHVVVVCLRSNFMFLCGRLLGSCSLSSIGLKTIIRSSVCKDEIRPIPHTPHIELNCGSFPI